MRSHLRQVTKKKVSDFLLREEGMIGSRTGFATAAVVSTTALAMTLLLTPDAEAANCGNENCDPGYKCCVHFDEENQTFSYCCVPHDVNCP